MHQPSRRASHSLVPRLRQLSLILALATVAGCPLVPTTHRLRVSLDVPEATLHELRVGAAEFGTVEYGTVTSYQLIDDRVINSITISPEETQIGTVRLRGFGGHRWTLHVAGGLDWPRFQLEEME